MTSITLSVIGLVLVVLVWIGFQAYDYWKFRKELKTVLRDMFPNMFEYNTFATKIIKGMGRDKVERHLIFAKVMFYHTVRQEFATHLPDEDLRAIVGAMIKLRDGVGFKNALEAADKLIADTGREATIQVLLRSSIWTKEQK